MTILGGERCPPPPGRTSSGGRYNVQARHPRKNRQKGALGRGGPRRREPRLRINQRGRRRVCRRPFAFADFCVVAHIIHGSGRARKFKYKGLWIGRERSWDIERAVNEKSVVCRLASERNVRHDRAAAHTNQPDQIRGACTADGRSGDQSDNISAFHQTFGTQTRLGDVDQRFDVPNPANWTRRDAPVKSHAPPRSANRRESDDRRARTILGNKPCSETCFRKYRDHFHIQFFRSMANRFGGGFGDVEFRERAAKNVRVVCFRLADDAVHHGHGFKGILRRRQFLRKASGRRCRRKRHWQRRKPRRAWASGSACMDSSICVAVITGITSIRGPAK